MAIDTLMAMTNPRRGRGHFGPARNYASMWRGERTGASAYGRPAPMHHPASPWRRNPVAQLGEYVDLSPRVNRGGKRRRPGRKPAARRPAVKKARKTSSRRRTQRSTTAMKHRNTARKSQATRRHVPRRNRAVRTTRRVRRARRNLVPAARRPKLASATKTAWHTRIGRPRPTATVAEVVGSRIRREARAAGFRGRKNRRKNTARRNPRLNRRRTSVRRRRNLYVTTPGPVAIRANRRRNRRRNGVRVAPAGANRLNRNNRKRRRNRARRNEYVRSNRRRNVARRNPVRRNRRRNVHRNVRRNVARRNPIRRNRRRNVRRNYSRRNPIRRNRRRNVAQRNFARRNGHGWRRNTGAMGVLNALGVTNAKSAISLFAAGVGALALGHLAANAVKMLLDKTGVSEKVPTVAPFLPVAVPVLGGAGLALAASKVPSAGVKRLLGWAAAGMLLIGGVRLVQTLMQKLGDQTFVPPALAPLFSVGAVDWGGANNPYRYMAGYGGLGSYGPTPHDVLIQGVGNYGGSYGLMQAPAGMGTLYAAPAGIGQGYDAPAQLPAQSQDGSELVEAGSIDMTANPCGIFGESVFGTVPALGQV